MSTLTNLNCTSILATSSFINDIVGNSGNYTNVKVSLQKNCCDIGTEVTTTEFDVTQTISSITLTKGITVNSVVVQSLVDGTLYTIPIALGASACVNITPIMTAINNYMTANFSGSDTFTQDDCDDSGATILWSLANDSGKYLIYSLNYTLSVVTETIYFSTPVAIFFSNTGVGYGLVISAAYSELHTFADGIYTVNITALKTNETIIEEQGCVFLDCETRCRVAAASALTSTSNIDATTMIMYHYGLNLTEQCMCDCAYLCDLFKSLEDMLNIILPTTTDIDNACGCS